MKKTTKIIGAVLGVLLVAALFTGAAAAEPAEISVATAAESTTSVTELYVGDAVYIKFTGALDAGDYAVSWDLASTDPTIALALVGDDSSACVSIAENKIRVAEHTTETVTVHARLMADGAKLVADNIDTTGAKIQVKSTGATPAVVAETTVIPVYAGKITLTAVGVAADPTSTTKIGATRNNIKLIGEVYLPDATVCTKIILEDEPDEATPAVTEINFPEITNFTDGAISSSVAKANVTTDTVGIHNVRVSEIEGGVTDLDDYLIGDAVTFEVFPVYTVIYSAPDKTNGTEPSDNAMYVVGEDVTVKTLGDAPVVKEGFVLAGWQIDGEGWIYSSGDEFPMPNEDVTLTAAWMFPHQVVMGGVIIVDPTTEIKGTYVAYKAYKNDSILNAASVWYLLDSNKTPTSTTATVLGNVTDGFYFSGVTAETEGLYQNEAGKVTVRVELPKIVATAEVINDSFKYNLEGGFVPKDKLTGTSPMYTINYGVIGDAKGHVNWQLVDEDGTVVSAIDSTNNPLSTVLSNQKNGIYGLQPYFVKPYLVETAPEGMEFGAPIIFTLGKSDDAKITLSAEKVTVGEKFIATVTGLPGELYTVSAPTANVIFPAQKDVDTTSTVGEATFTMPASGVFNVTIKAILKNDDVTITLKDEDSDASIEIIDGILTVTSDKEWYTIGDKIKLEGTYTSQDYLYFFIEGTNVPFTQIVKKDNSILRTSGEEWDVEITFEDLKKTLGDKTPDAGTYTVYVSPEKKNKDGYVSIDKKDITTGVYETAPVTLKQSFITLTSAPTVVAQGEKIVVEGTANASKTVIWYLFGTNFFEAGVQKVKDDLFTITIDKDYTDKDKMAAGQYFLVVQHPMYDENYSIAPTGMGGWKSGENSLAKGHITFDGSVKKSDAGAVYTSETGKLGDTESGTPIFNTDLRQRANAAQALCDALDSQNFDDMYAKASFIVGAPTSIINPIPAKATLGEKITISGTTTGHVGDVVSVEFLSTAFAAIPKQAVGTAAFVTVTTKVLDDGTWAIEFDTSNLNADDYTVSVAVGDLGPTNAQITIVKGDAPVTPTAQPTGEPTTAPTTAPTQTPASPGFGILAALAGLGAVAVLLLRRQ